MALISTLQAKVATELLPLRKKRQRTPTYLLMHMAEEVGECIKAFRTGKIQAWVARNGHPEGLASELADVVLDAIMVAAVLDLDLEAAINLKVEHKVLDKQRRNGQN